MDGEEGKFEPKSNLEGKNNFTRHSFIESDGSVTEVVRLNVLSDRHREDIIGFHFAQQYAKIHYGNQLVQPQFYIVGRDDPWDFEYLMHDGTTFILEVCRVADENLLKAIKIENDITSILLKPKLLGFEIQKVEKHFPGTLPRDLVEIIKTKADRKRIYAFENPDGPPKLFIRPMMNPRLDLRKELQVALEKKVAKKHDGKDRTIVVIDNLTTHSNPKDFFSAIEGIEDFLENLPFKSIWLYTGYYSDDNGYNCEYSLIPIKLTDDEQKHFV